MLQIVDSNTMIWQTKTPGQGTYILLGVLFRYVGQSVLDFPDKVKK